MKRLIVIVCLAGETRTGRIIESCNSDSRFVLKAGEGHRDMHKYWRENLQYVLQFRRRDDNKKMMKDSGNTARSSSEAFLAQVGDRFFLPPSDADPQARAILSNANVRTSWGYYASADLTAQADAIYFVRNVNAD